MIDDGLRAALAACARTSPLIVACDYDGTLSPIVPDPAKAVPHGPALEALVQLADMSGVDAFLISGRSLRMLRKLSGSPPSVTLIGAHGAEIDGENSQGAQTPDAASLVADLRTVAAQNPGTILEEKTIGAALHYRHAADPGPAIDSVRSVASRHGARVMDGKWVLEVLLGDINKGTALQAIRQGIGAECMVFIGDDTTDEDVFVMMGGIDVGIKVGEGSTAAGYRVADPAAVADVLATLTAIRQALSA